MQVVEEASVRVQVGDRDAVLRCDFVVPEIMLVVEAHGRQHYEFVKHFHQTHEAFVASCNRDKAKEAQVREAGYTFVIVAYHEMDSITNTWLMRKIRRAQRDQRYDEEE